MESYEASYLTWRARQATSETMAERTARIAREVELRRELEAAGLL